MKEAQIKIRRGANKISLLADDYSQVAYLWIMRNDTAKANQAIDQSLQYTKETDETLHLVFGALIDLRRYEDALRIARENLWGHRPFTTEWLNACRNRDSGNCKEAIKEFDFVARQGLVFDRIFSMYEMGRCFIKMSDSRNAIRSFEELQKWPIIHTLMEYPLFLYWTGRAYDLDGNKAKAKDYYIKFLELWKLAEPDLPEHIDARKRVKS